MKWGPGRLTFYVDNVQTGSWTQSVPARPMYIMLNFDVGGSWPGNPNSSTPTTAAFNVDYVRVYQSQPVPSEPSELPAPPTAPP